MFIDALSVKVRDGQVANRPFYAAIGSIWPGTRTCSDCGPATAPGISQVLVRRIDRPAQQRRHRHVLLDLRRT
ncbi:hypothetical protein [Mycobacterium intracellulare]|uniref:hypothetical protein n=1 Tax=Mycobacterium intracellulare TaxID=1767 RepID=UPI0039B54B3D